MRLDKFFRLDSLKSRLNIVEDLISKSEEINAALIKERNYIILTISQITGQKLIKKTSTDPKVLSNDGLGLDQKNHF